MFSRRRKVGAGTRAFVCVLLIMLAAFAAGAYGQVPSIAALRTSEHITLDGKLDEIAWNEAPVFTLTQQAPRPGQPNPYKTEVRVLASNDALYFGVVCHDPKPKAIAVHTQRRDGDVTGDD